jgi:hypothetical protein
MSRLPAITLLAMLGTAATATAQTALPAIETKTAGWTRQEGFLPIYWAPETGTLGIEVPRVGEELIFVTSLSTGIGSNDIGASRGEVGRSRIVRFDRVGNRLLMVEPNYAFRAESGATPERRAVEESFAHSVLWGFTIIAATGDRVLVDATDYLLSDANGVARTLKQTDQGDFRLETSRSAIYLPRTRGFPRNTEIEATLTFIGDLPGRWVRDVTPTPEAITLRQHFSFAALPEPGYVPRRAAPGSGYFGIEYADYSAPIGQPLVQRFIARYRLQKCIPDAAVSDAIRPIVYYVDPGVPEPVRSAVIEGAGWWARAFESIGYRNAFRVELLPDSVDPMDIRYNVIQWVHRATRGWSTGSSIIDPRTGEIIKGVVQLGSLRVRQDYLIAEGLLDPYATGHEQSTEALAMALARIRQLSAHEVGHTLGLAHNYIASTQGRASVMDYPHPLVQINTAGDISLDSAYAIGIGTWDSVAIAYGYLALPQGTEERPALDSIVGAARARGITFISDDDARPPGGAHPEAHLWDNGSDAAKELERVLDVRRAALARFGERAIPAGRPWATLEEAFVPLYLSHRYQTEAAVKFVGGEWYSYALRGDEQVPLRTVPAADQRQALKILLRTLQPGELTIPKAVLAKLPPRPFGWLPHRELFTRTTGLTFDALAPAMAAAQVTTSLLLQPERAARLVQQHALDSAQPGLTEVVQALVASSFDLTPRDGYEAEVARAVRYVVADGLMHLAITADFPQARAVALAELEALRRRMERARSHTGVAAADRAQAGALASDLARFLQNPADPQVAPRSMPEPPPGSPIGE